MVNFSITRAQMTELLVTATLQHEMPDSEKEYGELIRQKVDGVKGLGSSTGS